MHAQSGKLADYGDSTSQKPSFVAPWFRMLTSVYEGHMKQIASTNRSEQSWHGAHLSRLKALFQLWKQLVLSLFFLPTGFDKCERPGRRGPRNVSQLTQFHLPRVAPAIPCAAGGHDSW